MIRYLAIIFILSLGAINGSLSAQGEKSIFHEVKAGETKYGISRQYNITIEELEKFNPEIKGGLKEGFTLLIPGREKRSAGAEEKIGQDTGFVYHVVKAEETLYSLSRMYGVSMLELKQHNPELEDGLKIGQTIKIPAGKKPDDKQASGNFSYHKVQAGETAYSLSKLFNVSIDSLYLLNPGADKGLRIGQVLKFPGEGKDAALVGENGPAEEVGSDETTVDREESNDTGSYFLYKVKTGDSFYSLKQKFNVSRDELVSLNPELSRGLQLEKYIIIPKKERQSRDVSWLDRLFKNVESETSMPEGDVSPEKISEKEKLNNPFAKEEDEIDVEDTVNIDISKNYLVALMLPFNVNSIEADSVIALEFYNGFLMAADSLAKQGMNLTLNVFDTRKSLFHLKEKMPEFKKTHFDMVVGPLHKELVEYVADELEKEEVPVISPLSKSVDVKGRTNLIQCIPGAIESSAKVAGLLSNSKFEGANIVFVHTGKTDEREEVKQIKARMPARDEKNFIREIIVPDIDEKLIKSSEIRESLKAGAENVFVFTTEDRVLLSDMINKLRQMRDTSIYVVGPSRLSKIPTLEAANLNELNLIMPDVNFVNYHDPATNAFIAKYRRKYEGEPSRYAFQGYDVGVYFLGKLWKTGQYLTYSLEQSEPSEMLNIGFNITRTKDGGYQNQFLFLTGIRDLTLVKLKTN